MIKKLTLITLGCILIARQTFTYEAETFLTDKSMLKELALQFRELGWPPKDQDNFRSQL